MAERLPVRILAGKPGQPLEGMPLTISCALLAPDIGDSLGTMYSVASGWGSVLRRESGQIAVDLRNVATLSNCGDFPVMGELYLCYNADKDCPSSFDRGVLDNYRWQDDITSWSATGSDLRVSLGAQGGNLRARLDANGKTLTWAHFGTSIYSRYEGKTLCAGAGSELGTQTIEGTSYTMLHLRDLSWLEAAGAGQASGCLR